MRFSSLHGKLHVRGESSPREDFAEDFRPLSNVKIFLSHSFGCRRNNAIKNEIKKSTYDVISRVSDEENSRKFPLAALKLILRFN